MRVETIGDATLYLGDCLEIMPKIGLVDHIICDPPYESFMHDAKQPVSRRIRTDGGRDLKSLDFAPIDDIRKPFIQSIQCSGWLIAFCAPEGVGKWADEINSSPIKYKRACAWVKPDSTPQLNGQCPAMGAENFIVAWCGSGVSKWNGGGKRGVYTHLTNNADRHGVHPTEKPVKLMNELISDFTQPNQVTLDPFMGSGTTGVSCLNMGRKFIGIEREIKYFDIACKRIEQAYKQPRMFSEPVVKAVNGVFEL